VCEWIDLGTKEIASRYWCLDPIDGTKGFLRGDQYAVALALVVNGQVVLGVMACPNLPNDLSRPEGNRGTILKAMKGEGAFQVKLDGEQAGPIRVSSGVINKGSRFCESFESGHADHETHKYIASRLGIVEPSIRMDSQAKYGIVARGEASIYLRLPSPKTPDYREKVWDHAAGSIIIEEAGGTVTDVAGKALDFGVGYKLSNNKGIIATNGRVHEAVLSALVEMRQ
jgi:3'(2'), 5'-bisphosphate nucleotidase